MSRITSTAYPSGILEQDPILTKTQNNPFGQFVVK